MLQAKDISKTFFGDKQDIDAIENVSIDVKKNEFLVLLGPGQSGKTVFLNILSGLIKPTIGEVFIDGKPHADVNTDIATVFQKTGLFEWMTAIKNVELGLKYRGMKKAERRKIAKEYLELVGLSGFENSFPKQLSGGMKQRVGIARAYATDPKVLLMDEPFGALDAQTRYSMQNEILRIWSEHKRTVVFVTNNIEEALFLGDRIIQFTERPARVKKEYDLSHLSRPRDYVSEEFMAIRQELSSNEDIALD